MSRYIDAEDVEKSIDIALERFTIPNGLQDRLHNQIGAVPTADVVEVRHGHWIRGRKICDIPNDSDYEWKCSECYHTDVHNAKVQVDYCWHCGARMDGEEQEHE